MSEPDGGQTDALNKGLRRATGDIVAYINSDDYYLPGRSTPRSSARAHAARWVVGACRYVDADGPRHHVWQPELPRAGRHWWLLEPWGVPQPRRSGAASCSSSSGPFREDMHYVFDTEHGLRLAYAG